MSRSTRDFADADLMLLELMKPFFVATLERLHEMALLKAMASAQDGCDRLILVDGNDRVAWATREGQVSLEVLEGDLLAVGLRAWIALERRRQRSGGSPITKPLDDEPMQGRLLLDAYPGLDALHLARDTSPVDPEELLRLELTPRQREVLALLAQGRTSAEIASRLVISRRTVEKHLDAIFRRLGVGNRSQAILVAIRAQMDANRMN